MIYYHIENIRLYRLLYIQIYIYIAEPPQNENCSFNSLFATLYVAYYLQVHNYIECIILIDIVMQLR